MNPLQRDRAHGSPESRLESPSCGAAADDDRHDGVVWVAHSFRQRAIEIVERLRGLDLDAKLWNESQVAERGAAAYDIAVGDPAGLRRIAQCVGHSAASGRSDAPRPRRGGMAPGALRRVLAHIEGRLAERIEMSALASIAGLSECHFSRAFGQSVGMPPHRYVMKRRISVGASLIERTDRAFTDIALSVGFSDHSHFTRVFVSTIGETPSSYRRRNR